MELLVDSYTYDLFVKWCKEHKIDLFVKWCKEHKIPVSIAATEALRKFME